MARGRKPIKPILAMATPTTTGGNTVNTSNRQIPLFCTVCPEAPRFSDVSHLLTHIASKGHLHHETQTKLKAHQEFAAAQIKRKMKDETFISPAIKLEGDDLTDNFPLFPGFFDPEPDNNVHEEFTLGTDSLVLKGQVWPGMGKMDLADEKMKKTRNQKKDKSVVDRMKRASERVEPTQVIMTSEWEFERTKDVYDDASSPAPGEEESTPPKKAPKAKRKKPTPLAEISGNVLRRQATTRGSKTNIGKRTRTKKEQKPQEEPETFSSPNQQKDGPEIFRDHANRLASISEPPPFPSRSHRRYGARNMEFLQSNLVSPTPPSRDLVPRQLPSREGPSSLRTEPFPPGVFKDQNASGWPAKEMPGLQEHTYRLPGSFGHAEASYAMKDATIYNASSRLPFAPENYNQFRGLGPDRFRLAADYGFQLNKEEYPGVIAGGSAGGTNSSSFIGMPGANPLFSQDRSFLNPYEHQGTPSTTFSPLSFSPVNRRPISSHNERTAKPQAHMGEGIENNDFCDDHELDIDGSWGLQAANDDFKFHHGLPENDSQI
ncbi:hypothetical protein FGRMN_8768 [Fusarium graminum]|nr:hypothetical protein FGRMN_8768 [Fusarium graminum]